MKCGDAMENRTGVSALKKLLHRNDCEFVSLGFNCDVAHLLRYSGLRNKAYPFDWCITPNESVIKLIESDFAGFFDVNNFTFSNPHRALVFEGEDGQIVESDKIVVTAYCNKYNMSFPHDFPDGYIYHDVSDKYNKRVGRFLNLIKSNKTVVFIFKTEREENEFVAELTAVFKIKYPSFSFYVFSLDELELVMNRNLSKVVLKFVNRKVSRINKFVSRLLCQ